MKSFLASSVFLTSSYTQKLPTNILDLFGDSFKLWLKKKLESKGVDNSPIIKGKVSPLAYLEGAIFIDEGAEVEAFAFIRGPAYIGKEVSVRHSAYLRGNVYLDSKAVAGHSTEVKDSCFLENAKAGHFAYVGNSFLGENVNLGAGTKLANLKFDNSQIFLRDPKNNQKIPSGQRKFGAILGHGAQSGCNSVLSPGSIIPPNGVVLPCQHFKGTLKL
jgi:UDP-N-acetylglucosamine diphosphorylase / glucose-1-phosphate thymidylyltransferase / UDP-N-acetylgalactosamine diphosphorylase / glucosamine-1-phosphate N-acetyltransferase / galactosamine-1-phosphate N-acetyltransferase